MQSYGYISIIALFFYCFIFLTFLAAKKVKIVKYFLLLVATMICWAAGSVFMRLQMFPSYIFWYYVSLGGLLMMPYAYFLFVNAFGDREDRFFNRLYGALLLGLFLLNIPSGMFVRWPELVMKNGEVSFEYHYTWMVAILFGAAAVVLIHCFVNIVRICRKDLWYIRQFQPILMGIVCLFAGNVALLVPIFRGFPIDLVLGIVNAVFLIYALLRKRLFQLKLLASESSCYGMGLILTFLLYYNLMPYITSQISGRFPGAEEYIILIFAVLFLVTFWLLVFLWRKMVGNLFVREEERQTEKIRKYNNQVARSLHLEEILAETVEIIQETVESTNIYICIQECDGDDYQARYSNQPLNDLSFTIRKDNPIIRILERNEGILMREFRTMIEYKAMWEAEKRNLQDLRIEACIGLRDEEKIVGIILLSNPPGNRRISRADMEMTLTIASSASIAIKNAHLYETAFYEARTDELTKLLNRKYFFEVLNREFKANQEGSLALAIINIDDFKLYNQLYGTQAGDNALCKIAEIIRSSVGDSGYAARYSGKEFAVLLPKYDVFSARNLVKSIQRQIFQMTDKTVDYKLKVLTVSVGISAAPYAAKTAEELLDNADMAVNHVKRTGKNGIEIFDTVLRENSVREDETDHRNIYREYESTIYALTAAIDAKDHYTFSHSNDVAYYATGLARELNLNSDMVEIIRQAALLHDVGKIGIPEAILNKEGKLTEEEYEVIKGHVEASIGIIRHLPSLDYVIPAVIGHHERYDGKGYPRRIAGENIPLSARILCIADSFDAMTTKRSYKNVIPRERALEILEEEAGKQFDPQLVPVFVRGMREGRIQMAGEVIGGR